MDESSLRFQHFYSTQKEAAFGQMDLMILKFHSTGATYDISNKHRLGYSEVQLVQTMIDGVNALYKEDLELQKKHGL